MKLAKCIDKQPTSTARLAIGAKTDFFDFDQCLQPIFRARGIRPRLDSAVWRYFSLTVSASLVLSRLFPGGNQITQSVWQRHVRQIMNSSSVLNQNTFPGFSESGVLVDANINMSASKS